jgi:hypothetical protein
MSSADYLTTQEKTMKKLKEKLGEIDINLALSCVTVIVAVLIITEAPCWLFAAAPVVLP